MSKFIFEVEILELLIALPKVGYQTPQSHEKRHQNTTTSVLRASPGIQWANDFVQ